MPTSDPIALPELPEPSLIQDEREFVYAYDADDMRAYGQACVEALTPAPQVPEGMVLVPREATDEMMDAWNRTGPGWEDAYAAMLAAAHPLNELLGQPEEFNLNEVSGNPGQLASLEQRARELLDSECPECGGEHGFMQPGGEDGGNWHTCSTCRDGERLRSVNRDQALRAITAALNEASRAPQ